MNALTVGGLFSGIGGIELGLERAGMQVLWHCEADPFCQHILSERWPGVPIHTDVRTLRGRTAAPVDVLCGGFPCQDISLAGRGDGINGARSGLWREFARLIGELRPRYVVIENVAALLARGLDRVLADLAACGFDAEWDCVPASAVGAPHRRDRVWIVAYPQRDELRQQPGRSSGQDRTGSALLGVDGTTRSVADSKPAGLEGHGTDAGEPEEPEPRNGRALADPARLSEGGPEAQPGTVGERVGPRGHAAGAVGDPDQERRNGWAGEQWPGWRGEPSDSGWWFSEPDVGRVAHGIPARVDRLRSLGNAVVPQVAEWIGRRIIAWEEEAVTARRAA